MDTGPNTLTENPDLARVIALARRIPFVTLVHLIERLSPETVPLGTSGPSSREAIRLRHDPTLAFPSSDVAYARLETSGASPQVEIASTFLGLTGTASPLPLFFAEEVSHDGDDATLQRELFDVFHHRLLSLFVRALLKFDHARSLQPSGDDVISRWLLALGELSASQAGRVAELPAGVLLELAPLLAFYPENLERLRLALRTALRDELREAKIEAIDFVGGLVPIQQRERPRLGRSFRLNYNASLGARAKAPGSKVRVGVGPLDAEQFVRFSPEGPAFKTLCAVSELFLPDTIDVEVELTPIESIKWQLSVRPKVRLSRSTWLGRARNPQPVRFSAPRRIAEEVP